MAKVGRPSDYTNDMPLKLYKAMSEGKSVVRFCSEIDIHTSTFYRWTEKNEEFRSAFELASVKCEAYWENWLVSNFTNKEINSTLVKLFFANRFGWTDKTDNKKENIEEEKDAMIALKELLIKCLKEI